MFAPTVMENLVKQLISRPKYPCPALLVCGAGCGIAVYDDGGAEWCGGVGESAATPACRKIILTADNILI